MSEPGSGQIVSSHLLKLVLGVVFLTALAMLACSGSDGGSVSTPTAPPGMFSTLPTSEPPVLGDQPPTVELNTPEPTLTPQPTPTPNPTYTPVPTPTPLPTGTPTPNPTTATPEPTATPQPTHTPQPTYTPVPLPTSTPYPTATPNPAATADENNGGSSTAGNRALHKAVDNCNLELVKILIAAGANVNSRDEWPNEDMPLHKAIVNCSSESSEMVQFLVDSGADVNARSDWPVENPPLHLAIFESDIVVAKILTILAGADVAAPGGWPAKTRRSIVVREGNTEMAQLLIDSGADINAIGDWPEEYTPLSYRGPG